MRFTGQIALITGGLPYWGQWLEESGATIATSPRSPLTRNEAKELLSLCIAEHRRLDILVNADSPVSDGLSGMVMMTQLALPHLRSGSRIVNVCTPENLRRTIERFTLPFAFSLEERGIQVSFITQVSDLRETGVPAPITVAY